jgi:EmrB/QacA subfamily drug resistance transporter
MEIAVDASNKSNDTRFGVLASLSLSVLLSSLGTSSANVALPTLAQAFDTSFQEVQWVVLAYLLAMTALIVVVGRLGDLMGRRLLLLVGLLVFTFASVLCAAAPTLWILVAARAGQGLGAAAMMALAMALVGESVPKAKTGSAMGLLGTMSAVGTALGPSLGGVLIGAFGWRAIFLVNLPLGVAAIFLARRSLRPARSTQRIRTVAFDRAGMVLLAVTLGAYSLAMTAPNGLGSINVALLLAAFLGAALFLRTEARAASPLIRLAMFRNRAITLSFAMSVLVTTVVMATLIVGPFYLSSALGLPPAMVGALMSVGPLVAALAGVPSGRLVDRLGAQAMTLAGLAAMALGSCALMLMTGTVPGVWGYVTPLMVITAGYALFQAANNTAVMTGISAEERGVVAGLLNLSRNFGLITGASVMGSVFALGSGASDVTRATPAQAVAGMQVTFAVAAALITAALAVVRALGTRLTPRPGDAAGGRSPAGWR